MFVKPRCVHGDLYGEVVAEHGYAVAAQVGERGVAVGRGVAQSYGVDGVGQLLGDGGRVAAAVVYSVGGQHQGGDIVMIVAQEHLADVGGAAAKALFAYLALLFQFIGKGAEGKGRVGTSGDRLRHIGGKHDMWLLAFMNGLFRYRGKKQEGYCRHRKKAQCGQQPAQLPLEWLGSGEV